jgi:glycosyltransferase involved in cell wall biosynthesis
VRPLVSIIIPCLDAGAMLERCLRSCESQTYPSLEIVFVDNGSSDGSLQVAQAFAARSRTQAFVFECSQRGACAARNFGFERAHGEFIQWLDADDELTPPKIERQVAALEAKRDSDVAYGDWMFAAYGPPGVTIHPRPGRPLSDPLLELLLDRWRAPNSYLVRRSLAERLHAIQAFHPDTPVAQDREYFTLAAIYSPDFVFVPGTTAIHNDWSRAQVSKSMPRAARVRVLREIFARFREHAALQPAGRIRAEHRVLLDQSWDLYTVPPRVGFRLDLGTFVAGDGAGKEHRVTPLEALFLSAVAGEREPSDIEGLAFVAATSPLVTRAMAQTSALTDPTSDAQRTLRELAARGVLLVV